MVLMEIEVDLNNRKHRRNRKMMIEVIRQDDETFRYASKNLRMDPSFNLEAIKVNRKVYKWMYDEIALNNKAVLLETMKSDKKGDPFVSHPFDFKRINSKLKNDYDFVTECLKVDGRYFEDIPEKFKSDKKLVLIAIKQPFGASIWETKNLIDDEDVLFAHAKYGGLFYPPRLKSFKIPKQYLEDKKYIKEFFCNRNGLTNQREYKKLRSKFLNDKDLAKLAIQKEVESFDYFNKKFSKDRSMVLDAVKKHKFTGPVAMMLADKDLKKDKKFVENCINIDGNSILWVDKKFINDRKLVFSALNNGLNSFGGYVDPNVGPSDVGSLFKKYSKDKEFVEKSIKVNLSFFKYMDDKFKLNKKISKAAVEEYYDNCKYIPKKLKSDIDFFVYAVSREFLTIKYFDKRFIINNFKSNEKIILEIMKNSSNPWSFMGDINFFWKYVDKKLMRKTDFIVSVIKIDALYRSLFDEYDYNPLSDPVVSKVWGEIDDRIWNKDRKYKINLSS